LYNSLNWNNLLPNSFNLTYFLLNIRSNLLYLFNSFLRNNFLNQLLNFIDSRNLNFHLYNFFHFFSDLLNLSMHIINNNNFLYDFINWNLNLNWNDNISINLNDSWLLNDICYNFLYF